MIKIRYSDLPAGLHASARSEGRHTVIYLVPGLSVTDRQAAIDRLRASARVGHSPKLPVISLALAIIADRIRLNLRNAVAAARLHPIGVVIPVVVLAGGATLYGLFVTVSIRIGSPVPQAAPAPLPLSAATAPAAAGTAPPDSAGVAPTSASRLTGAGSARSASHAGSTASGQVVGASTGPRPTPSPAPSGSSSSPGQPSPSPTSGSPWPSPSPSPTRSHGSGGGTCLNMGPLGICVNL